MRIALSTGTSAATNFSDGAIWHERFEGGTEASRPRGRGHRHRRPVRYRQVAGAGKLVAIQAIKAGRCGFRSYRRQGKRRNNLQHGDGKESAINIVSGVTSANKIKYHPGRIAYS